MEKINLVELLKDCPKGMELDCTMFDNVSFEGLDPDGYSIKIKVKGDDRCTYLTENGCWNKSDNAKCVIYPKGKTTWEGFVPPCKFKDGDIIFTHTNASKGLLENSWVSIFKEYRNNRCACYACLCLSDLELYHDKWEDELLCELCEIEENRLATEEEKEKLFKAIKGNGYKWNEETKTLEKLNQPNFKVGNWVVQGCNILKIRYVGDEYYCFETVGGYVEDMLVSEIDSLYHLWTIQDAKDGDVLAFDNDTILIFKDLYNSTSFHSYCHIEDGIFDFNKDELPDWWSGEGFKPSTKEQSDILFQKMKEAGYEWDADKKELRKEEIK